jgi:hypothetical protein
MSDLKSSFNKWLKDYCIRNSFQKEFMFVGCWDAYQAGSKEGDREHEEAMIVHILNAVPDGCVCGLCEAVRQLSSPPAKTSAGSDIPGANEASGLVGPQASREYLDDPETWRGIGD